MRDKRVETADRDQWTSGRERACSRALEAYRGARSHGTPGSLGLGLLADTLRAGDEYSVGRIHAIQLDLPFGGVERLHMKARRRKAPGEVVAVDPHMLVVPETPQALSRHRDAGILIGRGAVDIERHRQRGDPIRREDSADLGHRGAVVSDVLQHMVADEQRDARVGMVMRVMSWPGVPVWAGS